MRYTSIFKDRDHQNEPTVDRISLSRLYIMLDCLPCRSPCTGQPVGLFPNPTLPEPPKWRKGMTTAAFNHGSKFEVDNCWLNKVLDCWVGGLKVGVCKSPGINGLLCAIQKCQPLQKSQIAQQLRLNVSYLRKLIKLNLFHKKLIVTILFNS